MRPIRKTNSFWAGRYRSPGWTIPVLVLAFIFCRPPTAGAGCDILRVRHWTAPDHTRVVIDLSESATYEIRRVAKPERISVNVKSAVFGQDGDIAVGDGLVRRIRSNPLSGCVQLVLDLQLDAGFKHFALPAADGRPARIVIDVKRPPEGSGPVHVESAAVEETPAPEERVASRPADGQTDEEPIVRAVSTEPFTVIIDAGHGGMDPGAIRHGVREKDVVLEISRNIARMINRLPGYRAELTRDGDYFVSLGRRVSIAKEKKGDLFLSIHANTHPRDSVAGMEVYFLSLGGATDREAQELADKENAADMVGLSPEAPRDDAVLSILMDLRMTQVLDRSSDLAGRILGAAKQQESLRARRVKQARLMVLRSLAMPSVLVELAYLSHGSDRRLLTADEGQLLLAASVVKGVLDYRSEPPSMMQVATGGIWTRSYAVRRGDTLWELARDNGTTVAEIRDRNKLRSSGLRVGQLLRLPGVD